MVWLYKDAGRFQATQDLAEQWSRASKLRQAPTRLLHTRSTLHHKSWETYNVANLHVIMYDDIIT